MIAKLPSSLLPLDPQSRASRLQGSFFVFRPLETQGSHGLRTLSTAQAKAKMGKCCKQQGRGSFNSCKGC